MRGRRRTLRPLVEPIESRALLSAGLAGASATRAMVRHRDPAAIHLNGTLRGQYVTNSPVPDAGTSYLLNGVDPIRGFGLASGLGEIRSLGFVASGYAQGDLSPVECARHAQISPHGSRAADRIPESAQ